MARIFLILVAAVLGFSPAVSFAYPPAIVRMLEGPPGQERVVVRQVPAHPGPFPPQFVEIIQILGPDPYHSPEPPHTPPPPPPMPQPGPITGGTRGEQTALDLSASVKALIEEVNIQKLVNGFDKNIIKQGNVVCDPIRNKVYVSGGLSESTFAVINPETDTIEDLFDVGTSGGIMALSGSGNLYILNPMLHSCVRYHPDTKTAEKLPDESECQRALDNDRYGVGHPRSWNGYELVGENTWDAQRYHGFSPTSTQNLNGLYNKIKLVYNGSAKGEIIHGPDTMFFDIDTKNGKIYASNTGDSSISVFDLKKLAGANYCEKDSCWVKDIDLGTTIDEILLDSSGNIYIRNRLGGSTIYRYNQSTKKVALFADNENNLSKKQAIWNSTNWKGGGISMWPTGFALRPDGKEMYVLSHYNASIDVIDTATGKFLSKIIFPVPWKPRTDSMSEITMDYPSNRMFGVWPELGLIGVADLTNRSVVRTIDLAQWGFDRNKAMNRGLRLVKLAYNSKNHKLYVFLTGERKLIMLDGKTFKKEKETSITIPMDQFNTPLLSNDDQSEIYLGNQIIDSLNLTVKSQLDPPSLIIVDYNNSDNSIYADQVISDNTTKLFSNILYKIVGNKATIKLVTGTKSVISAKYYFDFPRNTVYAYFMAEAKIRKYDLQKMQH
jgi:DNA-binding beta-propeller fold protein YncE